LAYKLEWNENAIEDIRSLDRPVAVRIFDKAAHLAKDPVALGKPLKGIMSGMMSYRVGYYRIVYVVDTTEKTVKVLSVGHRKNVYE
jgi:mRNA interferase RelE/StbE